MLARQIDYNVITIVICEYNKVQDSIMISVFHDKTFL